jgi:hypothetical protein
VLPSLKRKLSRSPRTAIGEAGIWIKHRKYRESWPFFIEGRTGGAVSDKGDESYGISDYE